MENASKALIIAGAILLSILIIGLGMQVYNNASATMGSANMSSQEISSHNSQFEAYEGRVKGSQIRSLIGIINQNNIDFVDRQVSVEKGGSKDLSELGIDVGTEEPVKVTTNDKLKNNTTYFVSFGYDDNNLLDKVFIRGYNDNSTTGGSGSNP